MNKSYVTILKKLLEFYLGNVPVPSIDMDSIRDKIFSWVLHKVLIIFWENIFNQWFFSMGFFAFVLGVNESIVKKQKPMPEQGT